MRRWLWSLGGCILILAGIAAGLWGLLLVVVKDEGTRIFPFWIGSSVILGALAIMLLGFWLLLRKGFGETRKASD